jgi:hypothetical protein
VAQFVSSKLPTFLNKAAALRANPEESITTAAAQLCKELKDGPINLNFSGTTAVFTLKVNDDL